VDGVDDLPGVGQLDPLAHTVPDDKATVMNFRLHNEHELCSRTRREKIESSMWIR
jgi:hypothetical protein